MAQRECAMAERDSLATPLCCSRPMDWVPSQFAAVFALTPGHDTGFYCRDYGNRSTEDLTPPGKLERLKRLGVISDPFDE